MKVNFIMVFFMEMVKLFGQMGMFLRVNLNIILEFLEPWFSIMEINILENLLIMNLVVKVNIYGVMEIIMKEISKITIYLVVGLYFIEMV